VDIQDLNELPGDISEKLTNMLSDEISKEIDKSILEKILDIPYQEELERFNKNENRRKKIAEVLGEEFVPNEPPQKRKIDDQL